MRSAAQDRLSWIARGISECGGDGQNAFPALERAISRPEVLRFCLCVVGDPSNDDLILSAHLARNCFRAQKGAFIRAARETLGATTEDQGLGFVRQHEPHGAISNRSAASFHSTPYSMRSRGPRTPPKTNTASTRGQF